MQSGSFASPLAERRREFWRVAISGILPGQSLSRLLSRRSALLFVLPTQTCARFHGRSPNRLSFSPFDASYLVYRLFLHFLANPSRKHFPRYWRTCPSSTTLLQSSHCASNFERKPRREREQTLENLIDISSIF